jgi:hypothetical protein
MQAGMWFWATFDFGFAFDVYCPKPEAQTAG